MRAKWPAKRRSSVYEKTSNTKLCYYKWKIPYIIQTKINDSAHTYKRQDEIRGRVNLKMKLEYFVQPSEKCIPQIPIDSISKLDSEPILNLLVGSSKRKRQTIKMESSVVFTVNIQNHTKGMEFQMCKIPRKSIHCP